MTVFKNTPNMELSGPLCEPNGLIVQNSKILTIVAQSTGVGCEPESAVIPRGNV